MTMLSQLSENQRKHLAWRLDHNTSCGLLTASAVARGDHGDLDLVEIFKKYGDRSERSAKSLARRVETFKVDERVERVVDKVIQIYTDILQRCKGMDTLEQVSVFERLSKSLKDGASLYRVTLEDPKQKAL